MSVIHVHVLILTTFVSVSEVHSLACEDQSPKACQRIAAVDPSQCKTSRHVYNLCRRTCGSCPLKCFSCDAVNHPSECHQIIECADENMNCIATQTITHSLEKKFRLGCVSNVTCGVLYGTQKGRRDVDLIGGCCNSDLCNKYDEPDKVSPPAVSTVHSPLPTSQGYSQACQEVDHEFCKLLVHDKGCTDGDVTALCPKTCGKCTLICQECPLTETPNQCRGRIICNAEKESCAVVQNRFGANIYFGYRLSCYEKQSCRGLLGLAVHGKCCDNNFCNGQYVVPTSTPRPTHHTTHAPQPHLGLPTGCHPKLTDNGCPNGFFRYGVSCYHIGEQMLTRTHAEAECRRLCSRLVIISNAQENANVTYIISHVREFHRHEQNHYWIDAEILHHKWHWKSTNTPLNQHYTNWSPTDDGHGLCGNIELIRIHKRKAGDHNHHHDNHQENYYWLARPCVSTAVPICEIPKTNVP